MTIRVWSLKDGSSVRVLTGHSSLVALLSISTNTLASGAADSSVRVWDLNTGELLHTLVDNRQNAIVCLQHDEEKVISGSGGALKLWNARDGTHTRDLLENVTGVWQVAFDNRYCVAATNRSDSTYLEILDFERDAEVNE